MARGCMASGCHCVFAVRVRPSHPAVRPSLSLVICWAGKSARRHACGIARREYCCGLFVVERGLGKPNRGSLS